MNGRHDSPSSRDTPRRTEPVLGDLRHFDTGPDRPARPARAVAQKQPPFETGRSRADGRVPRKRRRGLWVAAVVVAVLLTGSVWAWTHRATLSALLPQTQLNTLLTRAGQALSTGNLSGGPDSARDLYEAARALDPDNEQALAGLQDVGNAELARAKAALQRHDLSAARASLEEARSLLGGGADVTAVDQSLAKAVLHSANVDVLISQANAALANGDIDGNDGAAALFGKVLAGDPHNAVAQHGMDQIGDLLATRVQTQLGNNDREGAKQTLADLAGLLPAYAQLPNLRAAIAAADRAADAQRDQYLAQGEIDLHAGKFTGNGDDNALAQFKAALAADPGNSQARAGLGQVAAALIAQANAALDAGHPQGAKTLLDQAAALAPNSADLAAARSRLAAVGTSQAASSAPPASAGALTPAQSAKVARLVARAAAAARKGDIMLPPGDSAYDLYRTALSIDGNDAPAQAGLRGLPQITRRQFLQALADGNLDRAGDMLATLDQLDPGDPVAVSMRHDLGSAWLDRADHDARLGRAAAARTALQEAQRLVPQDPRISEVDARIRHDN
jgi:tetratricopeptide (TPR) repeat protein